MSEALDHPYFEKLRKYDNLPKCTKVFDWSWEHDAKFGLGQMGQSIKLDKELISTLIHNESLSFHPDEEEVQEGENEKPEVEKKNASEPPPKKEAAPEQQIDSQTK